MYEEEKDYDQMAGDEEFDPDATSLDIGDEEMLDEDSDEFEDPEDQYH